MRHNSPQKKIILKHISITDTELRITRFLKDSIFNFEDLFLQHYSSADFKEICQKFDLIFLQKIPRLQVSEINEIRRFTLFIDEVYEHKILLIMISKSTHNIHSLTKVNIF